MKFPFAVRIRPVAGENASEGVLPDPVLPAQGRSSSSPFRAPGSPLLSPAAAFGAPRNRVRDSEGTERLHRAGLTDTFSLVSPKEAALENCGKDPEW
ncbi:MAG: hypothetical protein D6679_00385 [Candidatus Hydrogenedentota bacterium]|nr:MAG: hypothetical protein D6679_00385 [Candidatus Hydrogenedentota bacterium]